LIGARRDVAATARPCRRAEAHSLSALAVLLGSIAVLIAQLEAAVFLSITLLALASPV